MLKKILAFLRRKERETAAQQPPVPPEIQQGTEAPVPAQDVPAAAEPLATTMVPEVTGDSLWVKYECYACSTKRIQWVSRQKNPDGTPVSVRIPTEEAAKVSYPGPFTAAGREYDSLDQLHVVGSGDRMRFKDIYGRRVFYTAERFPCFDSYDYQYEKRFYRWFFILEDGRLTRVYHTDDQPWTHITEDVENIEPKCLEEMQRYKFFEWEG